MSFSLNVSPATTSKSFNFIATDLSAWLATTINVLTSFSDTDISQYAPIPKFSNVPFDKVINCVSASTSSTLTSKLRFVLDHNGNPACHKPPIDKINKNTIHFAKLAIIIKLLIELPSLCEVGVP